MRSGAAGGFAGAFVALVLALATGRTHGWTLVTFVVIGFFLGVSMAEAWHRRPLDRD